MKNLITDTIEKIKKQKIVPESRSKFLVRKYGMWAIVGAIVILGSISLSVAVYLLSGLDWSISQFMNQNIFSYSLSVFPYFWAILIGIFLIGAFFEIRKTETGYRFSFLKIFLITIGSVLIIGLLIFSMGFGGRFNNAMNEVPYYSQHMMSMEKQWMQPENGLIAGKIISVSKEQLGIEDLNGKKWTVIINKETSVRPSVNILQGQGIKIIGTVESGSVFKAIEIRPWIGRGMNGAGFGQGMMGSGRGQGMMNGNNF